jgi:hypothetical protein
LEDEFAAPHAKVEEDLGVLDVKLLSVFFDAVGQYLTECSARGVLAESLVVVEALGGGLGRRFGVNVRDDGCHLLDSRNLAIGQVDLGCCARVLER